MVWKPLIDNADLIFPTNGHAWLRPLPYGMMVQRSLIEIMSGDGQSKITYRLQGIPTSFKLEEGKAGRVVGGEE